LNHTEHRAETRSAKTGPLATLFALLRANGRGAPAVLCALAGALTATLLLATAPAALADTAPTPTTEAATALAFTTVHVSGHVNPNAGPSTTLWHFSYREASAPEEEGSWVQPNADGEITPPASEESNPGLKHRVSGRQPPAGVGRKRP
jgi:hypothetical protein